MKTDIPVVLGTTLAEMDNTLLRELRTVGAPGMQARRDWEAVADTRNGRYVTGVEAEAVRDALNGLDQAAVLVFHEGVAID